MTLQRREDREWVDVIVDGKVVKSPVDIDALPVETATVNIVIDRKASVLFGSSQARQIPL